MTTTPSKTFFGQNQIPLQPLTDPKRRMRALVYHGKKDVRVEDCPMPLLTDSRDAILRITATTICGSDLHMYNGHVPEMQTGDILGHEFMGIIEEVGSDVVNLTRGQRVVVAFDIVCGNCDYCRRGEYSLCDITNPSENMEKLYGHRTSAMFGYSHLTGGVPGGQAQYVRVPLADNMCLPVPDDLPDEKALYLSDIIPTSLHGVEMGEVKEGSTVAIWGLGPVGLLTARWAKFRKASKIVGIDCVRERLDLAERLGIRVINFQEQNVLKALAEIIPGGPDTVIECAGFDYTTSLKHKMETTVGLETDSADILTEMITAVRKGGIVSILGVYIGTCNHFPIGALMEKGLTVRGGQCPVQKYWKYCLEKLRSGEFDPTFVITHKTNLEETPTLYEQFSKKEGVIKVFLRP